MFVWAFPTRLVKFQFTIHRRRKANGKKIQTLASPSPARPDHIENDNCLHIYHKTCSKLHFYSLILSATCYTCLLCCFIVCIAERILKGMFGIFLFCGFSELLTYSIYKKKQPWKYWIWESFTFLCEIELTFYVKLTRFHNHQKKIQQFTKLIFFIF